MKYTKKGIFKPGILFRTALFCICILTGCKDDELPDKAPDITGRQETLNDINNNIKALQQLIKAEENNVGIKTCTPSGNRTGYQIELTNGTLITVCTQIAALDGETNKTVYAPLIGAQERNGVYYWTIGGEWLFTNGATGSKTKVTGSDSVLPEVGIAEEGYWSIDYGNRTYTLDEKAQSGRIESVFRNVDLSNSGYVTFTFTGNTSSIVLPIKENDGDNPVTGALRRPISPNRPMWLIHIDSWTYPDPEKIIDMIPEDIRPFVVFNISLSTSPHDAANFERVEYGYETAKSWLRVCAEKNVWAMVQPASGAKCHFPDFTDYAELETSMYDEFYRDYPNFLGFNYSEQFWGFDNSLFNVRYEDRLTHWSNLMKLSHKYGGYLVVSFCNAYWGASHNPIAMFKRSGSFREACSLYPEHFILCEKYTSQNGFFDVESTCLGAYLSGYAGQYGIRFDECGWNGLYGDTDFPVAAGAIPALEHITLTGQTVIDGPELIWRQCYKEGSITDNGGYKQRNWEMFPQFENINLDIFRKILDGTVYIPGREEVIERTKAVIVHDVNSGSNMQKYSAPVGLYEGLYRMDDDGNNQSEQDYNKNYFKKTGRYPTIPIVYGLRDAIANTFSVQVNMSEYASRWGDKDKKVQEFKTLFPEEYTGNLYAGRSDNRWVTYNPTGQTASATLPLKYNTCDKIELTYAKYTAGIVKEHTDKLTFYLTNYSNTNTSLKSEVIRIFGSTQKPTYTYNDRGSRTVAPQISETWNNNILTLTVKHNGPLDITVNCAGDAMQRETGYRTATISTPASPQSYSGPRQHEAENFDYKNIKAHVKNAAGGSIRNYTALGYINFGSSSSAAVRDMVSVLNEGPYTLKIRYRAPSATVSTVELHINGKTSGFPEFTQTGNDDWRVSMQQVYLNKGTNTIELRANGNAASELYLDNIIIEGV